MPTHTLRKLVLPGKSENPYHELIKNVENLKRKRGSDYLEIILERASNIDDDIIIAVENKKEE